MGKKVAKVLNKPTEPEDGEVCQVEEITPSAEKSIKKKSALVKNKGKRPRTADKVWSLYFLASCYYEDSLKIQLK